MSGHDGVGKPMRGPQRRCASPLVEFRNKFVHFVQSLVEVDIKIKDSYKADQIKTPWLAHALTCDVVVPVVPALGAWIEWAIEKEKDLDKKRIANWVVCAERGKRWHPEIRSWLEQNRPLWAEATLAAEVYCESKREWREGKR